MSESLIAVTGATGQLGRLVVEALLGRGVPAGRIVAAVRDPEKAAGLGARGVQVRRGDYAQPETLVAALEGVGRLLLISGNEVGRRVSQHGNVVRAAKQAGVELLAYTSILRADASGLLLAGEHKETETLIRDSGLTYTLLRNGWYFENYGGTVKQALARGVILGSAGDGRVSAAARADYADAAAAVLTGGVDANRVYELAGDGGLTYSELAAEVARQSGREVVYEDLPADAYAQALVGFGLPEPLALALADADLGIKRGELFEEGGDLRALINRPTTTLAEAVAQVLKQAAERV